MTDFPTNPYLVNVSTDEESPAFELVLNEETAREYGDCCKYSQARDLRKVMEALRSPVRLRILYMLGEWPHADRPVGLLGLLNTERPNCSLLIPADVRYHLAILVEAGLVDVDSTDPSERRYRLAGS